MRSEEEEEEALATEDAEAAAAVAEEAEKADVAAAEEKGEAPFTMELLPPPPPPDARMSAMSDWGKNSAPTAGCHGDDLLHPLLCHLPSTNRCSVSRSHILQKGR